MDRLGRDAPSPPWSGIGPPGDGRSDQCWLHAWSQVGLIGAHSHLPAGLLATRVSRNRALSKLLASRI